MNRPIFFTSFFSMKRKGSKSLTSAAMVAAKPLVSNCVIGPTPLRPVRMFFQVSSVPMPTALTSPTPVTTTLRVKTLLLPINNSRGSRQPDAARRRSVLCGLPVGISVPLNVIDSVFHGLNLFGILVGDFNLKGFLKGHHEFHDVQRIRSQVVNEMRGRGHLSLIHSELFHNDLLHLIVDGTHYPYLLCLDASDSNVASRKASTSTKFSVISSQFSAFSRGTPFELWLCLTTDN